MALEAHVMACRGDRRADLVRLRGSGSRGSDGYGGSPLCDRGGARERLFDRGGLVGAVASQAQGAFRQ